MRGAHYGAPRRTRSPLNLRHTSPEVGMQAGKKTYAVGKCTADGFYGRKQFLDRQKKTRLKLSDLTRLDHLYGTLVICRKA